MISDITVSELVTEMLSSGFSFSSCGGQALIKRGDYSYTIPNSRLTASDLINALIHWGTRNERD